jgi:hypothetical protein
MKHRKARSASKRSAPGWRKKWRGANLNLCIGYRWHYTCNSSLHQHSSRHPQLKRPLSKCQWSSSLSRSHEGELIRPRYFVTTKQNNQLLLRPLYKDLHYEYFSLGMYYCCETQSQSEGHCVISVRSVRESCHITHDLTTLYLYLSS